MIKDISTAERTIKNFNPFFERKENTFNELILKLQETRKTLTREEVQYGVNHCFEFLETVQKCDHSLLVMS